MKKPYRHWEFITFFFSLLCPPLSLSPSLSPSSSLGFQAPTSTAEEVLTSKHTRDDLQDVLMALRRTRAERRRSDRAEPEGKRSRVDGEALD